MNTKKRDCNSLGLVYPLDVPTDYESFDELAGREGACLEEGISNVIYRGTNADFRAGILERIEERLTKEFPEGNFVREETETNKTKKVKDKETGEMVEEPVVTTEKEGVYFKRVVAQLVEQGTLSSDDKEVVQSYFQPDIDALCSETDDDGKLVIAFDPTQKERKIKSKKVPKYIMGTVETLFGLGEGAVANAVAKIAKATGLNIDPTDKMSVARALHVQETSRNREKELAQALAQ